MFESQERDLEKRKEVVKSKLTAFPVQLARSARPRLKRNTRPSHNSSMGMANAMFSGHVLNRKNLPAVESHVAGLDVKLVQNQRKTVL